MTTIRYSNTYELTQYYHSVFLELSSVARQKMLKALERPTFSGIKEKQPANLNKKSAKLQKSEEDDVSKLVKSLRQETSAYFGHVKNVKVLTRHELGLLEDMLSIRKMEEQYENGELDSNNFV